MSIGKPVLKYKKAPQAPKRFKSSYMFFSTIKHKEIRVELTANIKEETGQKIRTTDVAKLVSKAWKALPKEERERWDEIARQDKERYEIEKMTYTGPWKVPIYATARHLAQQQKNNKTQFENENATATGGVRTPERPLSAFLSFSNAKREYVKTRFTNAVTHVEIASILAQMWKDADPIEKKVYLDKQFLQEQSYNRRMVEWEHHHSSSLRSRNNDATTNNEPLPILTSMGHNTAYSTDMAATIFDDLAPYQSAQSMSSSSPSVGGRHNQHNEGQYQQQQQQQQLQHQSFQHYDHHHAYQYRPHPYYGEAATHNTNGYQQLPPTSSATNDSRGYGRGYDGSSGRQRQLLYEHNAHAAPPTPPPSSTPIPVPYDHHQQDHYSSPAGKQYQQQQQQQQPQPQPSSRQNDATTTGNNERPTTYYHPYSYEPHSVPDRTQS